MKKLLLIIVTLSLVLTVSFVWADRDGDVRVQFIDADGQQLTAILHGCTIIQGTNGQYYVVGLGVGTNGLDSTGTINVRGSDLCVCTPGFGLLLPDPMTNFWRLTITDTNGTPTWTKLPPGE